MILAALFAINMVAPDLDQRLARFKRVEMPFTYEPFTAREHRLIDELIAASRDLEDIYWRQNSPEDIPIYLSLAPSNTLRRYLWINGSRYDQVEENRPFIGTAPMPPGRDLFPRGITREEIEAYVQAHPAEQKTIYAERTVGELII